MTEQHRLEREKDEWMQKYFALLNSKEHEDGEIRDSLRVLEDEVTRLGKQALLWQHEKQQLENTLKTLRVEKELLENDMKIQQTTWENDINALKRALGKERQACTREIEAISAQFQTVKGQFQELKAQTSVKRLKRPSSVRSLSSDRLKSSVFSRDFLGKKRS